MDNSKNFLEIFGALFEIYGRISTIYFIHKEKFYEK